MTLVMKRYLIGALLGFLIYLTFVGMSLLLGLPLVLGYGWGIILIMIGAILYPLLKRKRK